ncbi:50S ribosomal protein L21 [Actinomyces sp. zg-332]|uniref:50S ribosomal protein L21 n=1 Tax=Actinomyces sp. zg-332 TaxID=2708340 RepID=UPI001423D64B|nr:50S ribosomal protein L21 [Actinomyces sp. zg-332]QPK94455.1 50S ribosomal protein L21 [Actinomyces sp. zg-332]
MSSNVVYAIVKAGGRQEKVSVGDVIVVDKLTAEVGTTVELEPVMIVDGDKVITNAKELESKKVTVEVTGAAKGPKITIVKYKNKTGYRKRMGHRQKLTTVKVTGIK